MKKKTPKRRKAAAVQTDKPADSEPMDKEQPDRQDMSGGDK